MRYDILKDFAPVGRVSEVPLVIVVHPAVPAKTTKLFIALAKSRPNDVRMAIGGTGTTSHLVTELCHHVHWPRPDAPHERDRDAEICA